MSSNSINGNKSVFVTDLSPDTTEVMLLSAFSVCGAINSIRICRDRHTLRSLCYGYVNFVDSCSAVEAINTLNFSEVNGKQIRVMASQTDQILRESNKANVFVKNLDKSIDNKSLFDMFKGFGRIISSKLAQDMNGLSKGFGFVQFESELSAINAILSMNGYKHNGKTLFVHKFMPKTERQKYITINAENNKRFVNIYVKNLSPEYDENLLKQLFASFGKVIAIKVVNNCFAFVAFENTVMTENALKALNGKLLANGNTLSVNRAQKIVQKRQIKRLAQKRCEGFHIYIKYLDKSFSEEILTKLFSRFGTVNSAHIKHNEGLQYSEGFVCFSSLKSAQKAVHRMNNQIINEKPLFVSIAQTIDDKNKRLNTKLMVKI